MFDHSNESHREVFLRVSVHYVLSRWFYPQTFAFSGPYSDVRPTKSTNHSPRTNREICWLFSARHNGLALIFVDETVTRYNFCKIYFKNALKIVSQI